MRSIRLKEKELYVFRWKGQTFLGMFDIYVPTAGQVRLESVVPIGGIGVKVTHDHSQWYELKDLRVIGRVPVEWYDEMQVVGVAVE